LWATIGGAIEPDETPEQAALREAEEEANGDQTSYVTTVFGATVIGGEPKADGDETSAAAWWDPDDLPRDQMSTLTRAILRDAGITDQQGRS
jgi:8-oxo-dGTP diphosphatase